MWLSSVLSGLMLTSFCLAQSDSWDPLDEKPKRLQCGMSARQAWYSYNGMPLTLFPWMIMVFDKSSDDDVENVRAAKNQICGGSLIHYKAVLTLASCLEGKRSDEIGVRAGKVDVADEREIHQDRAVVNIVTHPAYDPETHINDFAILVLRGSFTPAGNVITVCLPRQNQQFIGSKCDAYGWGIDDSGARADVLQYFNAKIVSQNSCTTSIANYLNRKFELHESFICTGLEGNKLMGVCTGDEGGPLTCPLPETLPNPRFVQTGVISKITYCGKTVSVYSNVAVVRDWIDDTFRANGIEQVDE